MVHCAMDLENVGRLMLTQPGILLTGNRDVGKRHIEETNVLPESPNKERKQGNNTAGIKRQINPEREQELRNRFIVKKDRH